MKFAKIAGVVNKLELFTKRNTPTILMSFGIVGIVTTGYSAYKAGLKAEKIVEMYKQDIKDCKKDDKDAKREVTKELVKNIAPVIIPPIIFGSLSIACIIGSHTSSNRRIAALTAAYTLSENTVKGLNEKMEEILGEKKAKSIKDSLIKDKFKANGGDKIPDESKIIITGDGNVLCKDMYTGRFFRSNSQKIEQVILKASSNIRNEMYLSLNEFYSELGLEPIPMGNDVGWNVEDLIEGRLPIEIAAILTEEGQPCICLEYNFDVKNNYKFYY